MADGPKALAALWGFAEATVFFIVPDVLLSRLALRSPKAGFLACLYALAGALVGGAAMWVWGSFDPQTARQLIASLPATDAAMIASVHQQLADDGIAAIIMGPLRGVPYKIYAVEAATLGHGLATFLAVSIPGRLIRFVLVTALAAAVARGLRGRTSPRSLEWLHLASWTTFYAWFFSVMPA